MSTINRTGRNSIECLDDQGNIIGSEFGDQAVIDETELLWRKLAKASSKASAANGALALNHQGQGEEQGLGDLPTWNYRETPIPAPAQNSDSGEQGLGELPVWNFEKRDKNQKKSVNGSRVVPITLAGSQDSANGEQGISLPVWNYPKR